MYQLNLTEKELFICINELLKIRFAEKGKTKKYVEISKLLDKFDDVYFKLN